MHILPEVKAMLAAAIGFDSASIGVASVERAVHQRMTARALSDEAGYLALLTASDREREALIEQIVVPETWFFRDDQPFRVVRQYVLEEWLPRRPSTPLRVMSIPCATGEEPYSLAMTLFDCGLHPTQWRIDAFDVSKVALSRARQAVYGKNSFRGRELSFRDRYFHSTPEGYALDEAVRRAVAFAPGNVLDPDFAQTREPYDLIFFRNLLIYLSREHQERALAVMDRLLAPTGLLLIGHAEPGPLLERWFVSARYPLAFAYRKRSDERRQIPGSAVPVSGERRSPRLPQTTPATRTTPADPGITVHSPRPLAGEGLGVRAVDSTTDSLTLTLSPLAGGEGTERLHRETGIPPPAVPAAKKTPPPALPVSPPDPLAAARALADRGQWDEARQQCQPALRIPELQAEAYVLLGLIHDATQRPAEAEACFHKAVYLEPNHAEALLHLALAAERRGDLEAAHRFRQRARRAEDRLRIEAP